MGRRMHIVRKVAMHVVSFVLVVGLSGCDQVAAAKAAEQQLKMATVAAALEGARSVLGPEVLARLVSEEGMGRSEGGEVVGVDELTTQLEDPMQLVENLVMEEGGMETLDFLYTAITTKDPALMLDAVRPLVGQEDLEVLAGQVAQWEAVCLDVGKGDDAQGRACASDKEAHVLAGAGIALFTAGLAYFVIPWFHPAAKITTLALYAFLAAVFVGAVKEIADMLVDNHTSEIEDFFATAGGGCISAVLSLFPAILISPVLAGILCVGLGVSLLHDSGTMAYVKECLGLQATV